jgi:magnesium chelatase family protein
VTINLAPADLRKEGPSFDLPIAIGMMLANRGEGGATLNLGDWSFVGELALGGKVRAVRGVLPVALEARRCGRRRLAVPVENVREAAIVEGLEVYGVTDLREAYELVTGTVTLSPYHEDIAALFARTGGYDVDYADVRGQHHVKRAIEIAAAGNHNLLMIGPPGSGKSMLAKRVPSVMPALTLEEAVETTKIHSIAGLLVGRDDSLIAARPFRAPHHTISDIGLLGGSAQPTPGEISAAHNGVLFLDELPEFKRSTLEVLRQPLEDGRVTISRAAGTMTFPADFLLVAAMNPCPCGFFGDPRRACRCVGSQIQRYRDRISGPLLDRIDMHVEAPAVAFEELRGTDSGESSSAIRTRVEAARARQTERFRGTGTRVRTNARMTGAQVKRWCALDAEGEAMLKMAMESLHFSARAYERILKVSRTIADLDHADAIRADHLAEAVQYRSLDRNLWG